MNDHMRWIDGHDFDLVPWQGGVKFFEFGDSASGDSHEPVKFLGQSLLDGTSMFEILIILPGLGYSRWHPSKPSL